MRLGLGSGDVDDGVVVRLGVVYDELLECRIYKSQFLCSVS